MHSDPQDDDVQGSGLPPREPVSPTRPQPLDPLDWRLPNQPAWSPSPTSDDDAPHGAGTQPGPEAVTGPPGTSARGDRREARGDAAGEPGASVEHTAPAAPQAQQIPVAQPTPAVPDARQSENMALRFRRRSPGESSTSRPPSRSIASTSRSEPLVRVGIWGAAGGGKTTFLAALPLAVLSAPDENGSWTISGATDEASEFLLEMTQLLDHEKRFPQSSQLGMPLSWYIAGEPRPRPAQRRGWGLLPGDRRTGDQSEIEFVLDLQDMPGGWFVLDRKQDEEIKETVLNKLADADGLLYLFDPVRDVTKEEDEQGNFRYFQSVLEHLMTRLRRDGKLVRNRLPHHVAVCVTKFDHPALFNAALKSDWASTHPVTNQPYIPDRDASKFFGWLCEQTAGSGADRVRRALEQYFLADRVAYFVCSAIGFRLDEHGAFDPSDYANVVTVDNEPRIRDRVRPINILEPVVALERRIRTGKW